MTTDIERKLRDLFDEKAREAPLAAPSAPAAAPQRVLRRGRLHQVGTVLGSGAIALALIVGSVAGLNALLRGGEDRFRTGQRYEVFERTATIEAFTVTSPSDWYLVNHWPASMSLAVGSASASETCTVDPSGNEACVSEPQPADELVPQPYGLPAFQLSNEDIGLEFVACGGDLPSDMAVLYVALDHERAIEGVADPSLGAWPGTTVEEDEPCGRGTYSRFTVNGEPFFAWIGFGASVTDEDRTALLRAYESLSVDDGWAPTTPDETTPAYVIAGGTLDSGEPWRLDLRPGPRSPELFLEGVDRSLLGVEEGHGQDTVVPSIPIEYCCAGADGALDVTFGFVRKGATGVEFRVTDADGNPTGEALTGTIVPLPPTLSELDADLFFVEETGDLLGEVVPIWPEGAPAPTPPPVTGLPRAETLELSGSFEGQDWTVRFTGAFGDGTACIRPNVAGEPLDQVCPRPLGDTLAGAAPHFDGWLTSFYLLAGSVPPEVVEIRFAGDDDAIVPTQVHCQMGPIGWTDPDRRACVVTLPSAGSGTLRYLDAEGAVLFEEGIGWGTAQPEVPTPVDPVHGGTYWGVYPWVGPAGSREADDVVAALFDGFGIRASQGDLACDQGAAEALGTDAEWRVAVYFETERAANEFALQAGVLGHEADPVVARVTTYCLD